jgi:hypothetical protein
MKNILLVSVFITNKALSAPANLGHSRTGSPLERLEIFLTSLRSWAELDLKNPHFFIELDDNFVEYQSVIASLIESKFENPVIRWSRLLHFEDWALISSALVKQGADLITLIANDDHVYVHTDSQPFENFCSEVLELSRADDGRGLGDLTHFPGPIRTLSLHSNFDQESGATKRALKVTTIHGCCLVTPILFAEWWSFDFTEGKRIPRPDNPFGPSVQFAPADVLVPRVEIFRHIDGIGDGTRISRKYNVLRPTFRILTSTPISDNPDLEILNESPWTYGLWPRSPNSHNRKGGPDLYRMFPQTNSPIERFIVDMSRLIVAFQKVYAPWLSREFISNQDSNVLYIGALNIAILLDFSVFFNFVIWLLFDFPNQIAVRISICIFGKKSVITIFLMKIRNRIFQHLSVGILRHLFFISD